MGEDEKKEEIANQPEVVSWEDFLQEHPPGSFAIISGAVKDHRSHNLLALELHMHCPEPTCSASMFFETDDGGDHLVKERITKIYLTYTCRNCGNYSKSFAVAISLKDGGLCDAYKFGELPPFGPPVPSRVLRLIQPDRELFLSGRRCENQGLGIGAFTYYRRVVENQWVRLVDEIIKVGKVVGVPPTTIDSLEASRDENQFSKAVYNVKDAIPPVLLINGQNPLVLLHGPLSQGVHNLPDAECLHLATSIRLVLVELAEKLGNALKDERELTDAVNRLMKAHSEKKGKKEEETD